MNTYLFMKNFDHILLFKTDIRTPSDKMAVRISLDLDDRIQQWSIDQDDEDCVLRIVTPILKHHQIIDLITHHGFNCCELT
jgi:hypothetical protein